MNLHATPILKSLACAAVLGFALTGCTNTGTTTGGSGGGSETPEGTQQSVASAEGPTCSIEDYGAEKIDLKDAVVGFSQSEKEDNPFRIAETQSIKDEAEKLGVKKLITTNAQSTLSKQISDIQDMISQGAQALIVAPLNSDGLEPALQAARDKNIPVITIDRKVNATACEDYVTFLGSNFVEQGKRAADQLIEGTGGEAKVAILLGSSGNAVTTDRTKGFKDQVAAEAPGIEIVAEQTGDFARDKGQSVTEQLLQANPDITAIYAENDEMGLGAQAAIVAAGKTPGEDIQIYSIDGTRNAVEQITAGSYNGVIESNPRFGPLAFQTLVDFMDGKPVGQDIIIADSEYDPSNAAERVNSAY
ncbi:ABC transporter substrate-binding protein [Arthrobacter sp. MSA 4-2]|uniref:ABC transporter substrate-binding protein n=1 Tax=Arthrobacter sp. MSA 4-2 TaxID=2794349 RepID=UPI0018E843E1|nr:ABC transporter substrate-binding protein [Arthrobacter sp. MSA 4-2]MBJ2121940.1 ABC transporter substrate-binding protein [Arthrobacter sp. MSA 4-2]